MNNTKTKFNLTANGLCNDCREVILQALRQNFPFIDIHMEVLIMAARVVCDRCGNEDKNHWDFPAYKDFIKDVRGGE